MSGNGVLRPRRSSQAVISTADTVAPAMQAAAKRKSSSEAPVRHLLPASQASRVTTPSQPGTQGDQGRRDAKDEGTKPEREEGDPEAGEERDEGEYD